MEVLGVQRSHPGSRACTFETSQFRNCRLLLLYPGDSWKDLPRLLGACSRWWRPAHCPGGEWMTLEREPPRQSLKVRLPLKLLKCGHQTTASSSKDGVTPSKVWKETEAEEAEVGTLTGPSEAALQKAWFELYQKDLPVVQEVRARILKLKEGEVVTQRVLDSSPAFHLRRTADETRAPTVIGEHWIDHLDAGGHIAKCKPHDFKFEDEWLPLYTRAGVTRHVSGLSSLLKTQGDSPLISVVPSNMLFRSDREYVIHKLHEEDCLSQVAIYYGENL